MIPYWMSRTQLMLGDEPIQALMSKNVLVVGLGGVGGSCRPVSELTLRVVSPAEWSLVKSDCAHVSVNTNH